MPNLANGSQLTVLTGNDQIYILLIALGFRQSPEHGPELYLGTTFDRPVQLSVILSRADI
jgi:hypothetical protein